MAHWIVEDHGFCGKFYRCSNCRNVLIDTHEYIPENTCPKCGIHINKDKTKYIDKPKIHQGGVAMYSTFTKEPLHIDDVVVYLKNERTGSSTVRKCKFVGQVVGFAKTKVEIHRLSQPDTFVTPDETQDLGVDSVAPDDVVYIIISKYQEDSHIRTLKALNEVVYKQDKDIKMLIGKWFVALEDEGINPWMDEECMKIANKHYYTEADYKSYLRTLV